MISLGVALTLLSFTPVVAGFGTINEPRFLQQHNEHEFITRLAFQCPVGQGSDGVCFEQYSLDQLAGHHVHILGIPVPGLGSNGAVGAPDTFDMLPEGPEAHCDDADYLDIPGYPQTRAQANAKLQACIDHLRIRFRQAVNAAARLLDERNRVGKKMVRLISAGDCTFAFPGLQNELSGRAKCAVLEGFGRALHGIQDFYAHSNWVDSHDPRLPISVYNPPGLGMNGIAPFLDLRGNTTIPVDQIPRNLTTGCFALPDALLGSGECQGRITHHTLSKDKGTIYLDGTFGEVEFDLRSQAVSSNFPLAVRAAVQHSRMVWADLRDELRLQYGPVVGELMICSMVHDNPVRDCRKRTLAVAVDTSSDSELSGGLAVEELVAQEVDSRLSIDGQDRVALITNQEKAALRYPMGPPSAPMFNFSRSSAPLCLDCSLELAIAETINAQAETYTDRGAILLITTGAEPPSHQAQTLQQLARAAEEGIRVHYACITLPNRAPPSSFSDDPKRARCSPFDTLVAGVLKTGGVAAFINPLRAARAASHFADTVMDHGLTATDDDDATEHTRVYPGVALADFVSADHPSRSFAYPVSVGEHVNITVSSVADGPGGGAEGCFTVTLWYKYLGTVIEMHPRCGDAAPLELTYEAAEEFDLVLEAEIDDTPPRDQLLGQEEILFLVTLDTDMPEKEETAVGRTTRDVSSRAADGDGGLASCGVPGEFDSTCGIPPNSLAAVAADSLPGG